MLWEAKCFRQNRTIYLDFLSRNAKIESYEYLNKKIKVEIETKNKIT